MATSSCDPGPTGVCIVRAEWDGTGLRFTVIGRCDVRARTETLRRTCHREEAVLYVLDFLEQFAPGRCETV